MSCVGSVGFGVTLFVYVLIRLRVHKMSTEGYATVTLHRDNEMTKITVSARSEVAVKLPLSGSVSQLRVTLVHEDSNKSAVQSICCQSATERSQVSKYACICHDAVIMGDECAKWQSVAVCRHRNSH